MSKEVRKEFCKMCEEGIITFVYHEDIQQTLGSCDSCGYCCDAEQDNMLTLNLPNNIMQALQQEAEANNTTPEKVAKEILNKYADKYVMS